MPSESSNNKLTSKDFWERTWENTFEKKLIFRFIDQLEVLAKHIKKIKRLLKSFTDEIGKPVIDIIELGCAPGNMLKILYEMNPINHLYGIDYADKGVEYTKNRLLSRNIKATIYHGDIFSFKSEKLFDLVISFGLIEHFKSPLLAIKAHRNFAKNNAMIVVIIPNFSFPLMRIILEKFSPITLFTHNFDIMNKDILHKTMVAAGLYHVKTGFAGGANLIGPEIPPTLISTAYKYFARIWNVASFFLPEHLLWDSYIWGSGYHSSL